MKVRMYDCGFGDCFRLESDTLKRLYVDFGIHRLSMKKKNREKRYDLIISQIPDGSDFLLTHYHEDHYAGVIYMIGKSKKFRDIYIPDVWRINGSVDAIKLILLRGLIEKTVLRRGLSIIQFLKAICSATGRVHFVKRGVTIQNEYIALWPSEKYIEKRTEKLVNEMDDESLEELTEIAEKINKIVVRLSELEGADGKVIIMEELDALEEEYQSIAEQYEPSDSHVNLKLSKYQNEISIVFQNIEKDNRHVLFTGDVGTETIWEEIEKNDDHKIAMFGKYDVIKIPHHGTESYYYSFVGRCRANTVLLIPNGIIPYQSWYIDARYSADANSKACRVVCADNWACNANPTVAQCVCNKCTLACNPYHFVDV